MAQTESWNLTVTHRVGQRVAYFRKRIGPKGITAQELADRCEALGHALDRTVIAKLESGKRQSVTVADLVVLASALGVSPVALVIPVDQAETVEILPGRDVPTYEAMTWFTGESPLPGDASPAPDPALIPLYREHAAYVDEWTKETRRLGQFSSMSGDESDPAAAAARVKWALTMAEAAEKNTRRIRGELRRAGARLPELPAGLAHIDDGGDGQ